MFSHFGQTSKLQAKREEEDEEGAEREGWHRLTDMS